VREDSGVVTIALLRHERVHLHKGRINTEDNQRLTLLYIHSRRDALPKLCVDGRETS
jgi:hypothetical protein